MSCTNGMSQVEQDYIKFLLHAKLEDSLALRKAFSAGWVSSNLETMRFVRDSRSPRDEDLAVKIGMKMAYSAADAAVLVGMPADEAKKRLDALKNDVLSRHPSVAEPPAD